MPTEEEIRGLWKKNPMFKPRIEKVTVNMGVGQSGDRLEKAVTVLKDLTGQQPCRRKAKQTIREFGIRKGESIACMVTLRDERATEFLSKTLQVTDNKLSRRCFDKQGNFSFGIKEHIELPGVKYVPALGIFGMNINVAIGRLGYRVKYRRRYKSKIGPKHLLTPEEAILFVKEALGVEIS